MFRKGDIIKGTNENKYIIPNSKTKMEVIAVSPKKMKVKVLDSDSKYMVSSVFDVDNCPESFEYVYKYEVGDTIIATMDRDGCIKKGAVGKVVYRRFGSSYLVQFTKGPFNTKSCGEIPEGVKRDLGMWWIKDEESKKVKETIKEKIKEKGEQEMFIIKELKTYAEIQQEGRNLRNGLSQKQYVKILKDQNIKVYACRKIEAPDVSFVAFAVFPANYKGGDSHLFEKWGDKFINIRAYNNALPNAEVMTFVKAWLYGQGVIEVPPKRVDIDPAMTINNGTVKVIDVYDADEFFDLVRDLASSLIQGKTLNKATLVNLGYTVK